MLKTITLFVSYWLVTLAALILVLSVVSCDCNDYTSPPKRTVDNPPTTVINNYNDNYNDSELNDRLTSLESRVDTVELRLLALEDSFTEYVADINTKLVSLQSTVSLLQSSYAGTVGKFNEQILAIFNSLSVLEITINGFQSVSNTRYTELINKYNAINSFVIHLTNVSNANTNQITILQTLVSNLQINALTVAQVNTIVHNAIANKVLVKQPCGLDSTSSEVIFVIDNKVYAFLVSSAGGGLIELKTNTVYHQTVGFSCEFKFTYNPLTFFKL